MHTKDDTFIKTKNLRSNEDIIILSGDKDKSCVILNKQDYIHKIENLINEGIAQGKYTSTTDNTLKELSSFQTFLRNHFKKHEKYDEMRPTTNQPGRLFATAKTHKFSSLEEIDLEQLKLRPIIDQTGSCYYKAGKVIAEYLKPLSQNEFVIIDTQSFPDLIKNTPISDDEEDVSYDVESLFTNIPVRETIDYILDQIYNQHKLKPMCKKSIFKKLLYKLTTECTFSANNSLYKQVDGVTMGGPLSVVFTGCFMNKMEQDVVVPLKPKFYKRFVDDTYSRRKKGVKDELFDALNSYHKNIRLTIEVNPEKFLDTNIVREGSKPVEFKVYDNVNKVPFHWSSKVPKKYKRGIIIGELHRAKRISTNFDVEIKRIYDKFIKAGYPYNFIKSIVSSYDQKKEELLIPDWLFPESKKEIYFRVPYCPKNEQEIYSVIRKLEQFTNNEYQIKIIWNTTKLRSLFKIKDKTLHQSNVIYEGECTCNAKYIGETERNAQTRWSEHNSNDGKSRPSKHLIDNPTHEFSWRILSIAPRDYKKRKILEAYYIRSKMPNLNDQLDIKTLYLFRNGIT